MLLIMMIMFFIIAHVNGNSGQLTEIIKSNQWTLIVTGWNVPDVYSATIALVIVCSYFRPKQNFGVGNTAKTGLIYFIFFHNEIILSG